MMMSIRVRNPNQWLVKGRDLGLLVDHVEILEPEVLDENGDVVTPAVTETTVVPLKGLEVHKLPPVVKTPGEYDEEGNVIVAPTYHPQEHYDLATSNPEVAALLQTIWDDAVNGNDTAQANKSETAYRHGGLEIMDVESVNSRSHHFL